MMNLLKRGAMLPLSPDELEGLPLHILKQLQETASQFDPKAEFRFVGGCVRDLLLGREPKDIDVVTNTTARTLEQMGLENVGKAFPVYLYQDPEFGQMEVAVARSEEKTGIGHKGFDTVPTGNFHDDQIRRDLTINALMVDADGNLYGPDRALEHIKSQTLENTSDKFSEDPLRVFRVARFSAQFGEGWKTSPALIEQMQKVQHELQTLPMDRVREEFRKAMNGKKPMNFFTVLQSAGCLEPWFGEIEESWTAVEPMCAEPSWDADQRMVGIGSVLKVPGSLFNRLGLSEGLKRAAEWVKSNRHRVQQGSALAPSETVQLVQSGNRGTVVFGKLLECTLAEPDAREYFIIAASKLKSVDMTGVTGKDDAQARLVDALIKTAKQHTYEEESKEINEHKKTPEAKKNHKFQPADWTYPNGHPRCKLCGSEEMIGGICKSASGEHRVEEGYTPNRVVTAYKLFRVKPNRPGKLFPLYTNSDEPVPVGKWVDAEIGEITPEGKVKSKLGPLAFRPGWHGGDSPAAPHIGLRGQSAKPTHRPPNQVWAEIEVAADVDWQAEANRRMQYTKKNDPRPGTAQITAQITDQVPYGGHYRYKTNPNMLGNWIIGGNIRVNHVLSQDEVEALNLESGVSDLPRSEPLDLAQFGFGPDGKPKTSKLRSPLFAAKDTEEEADEGIDQIEEESDKELSSIPNPAKRDYTLSLISPRLPNPKKEFPEGHEYYPHDPKRRLQPNLPTMLKHKKVKDNLDLMTTHYPGMKHIKGPAKQKANKIVAHIVDNLVWLFEEWIDHRDVSREWYVGGHSLIERWAERFKMDEDQVAGVLASLSPQRDWFSNVTIAERILIALKELPEADQKWTPRMDQMLDVISLSVKGAKSFIEQIRGKTLTELTGKSPEDLYRMSLWIRTWDEAENDPRCLVLTPHGQFGGVYQNEEGKPFKSNKWCGIDTIIKCIRCCEATSSKEFSTLVSQMPKVRSFYNNLLDPHTEEDVTIDTHAIAAALLRPLGSSSAEARHGMGLGGSMKRHGIPDQSDSSVLGLYGLYSIYAEAYRQAAKQVGVLPRELQSVTWEAAKNLFRASKKQGLMNAANQIWESYSGEEIDSQTAREKIKEIAGGFGKPAWFGSDPSDHEVSGDSSFKSILPRFGPSGTGSGAGSSGTGGGSGASSRTKGRGGITSSLIFASDEEEDEYDDGRWEPVFPTDEDNEPGAKWQPIRNKAALVGFQVGLNTKRNP